MNYPRIQSAEAWAEQLGFASLESRHGLPKGVLTNLVRQESQGNCDAQSGAGALGLCQFMAGTARDLGVDRRDPSSSANGAAKYLEQMMDMFDGDINKALAAYNWGPGNMRKAVRLYGDQWAEHIPPETRHYVAVVGKGIGPSFIQREAQHTLTPEEIAQEDARRHRALKDLGFSPDAGVSLIGQIFFSLAKFILEKKFPELAESGLAAEHVTNGTTVAPAPARGTVQNTQVAAVGNTRH